MSLSQWCLHYLFAIPTKLCGKSLFYTGSSLAGWCDVLFALIEFPMYFVLALHQPPDPAVVAGSETQLPTQQQTNILQVRRVYHLYR